MSEYSCHSCGAEVNQVVVDLGLSPFSNAFITDQGQKNKENKYPLVALVCPECRLVQLSPTSLGHDHFHEDYVYFSSFSESWLQHAKNYQEMITERFGLNNKSKVIEIASNDGYLLQYFVKAGIPCLGIEPSKNTADAARIKGIECREEFFNTELATKLVSEDFNADLLIGNNVLAHVPNIDDFVAGLSIVLKENGVVTLEFPHLLNLLKHTQFDTIYHEHFSYLSLIALEPLMKRNGLRIFDVEKLPTHGGSLRVYACHDAADYETSLNFSSILQEEIAYGIDRDETYKKFQERVLGIKEKFITFLEEAKQDSKVVVGYGAAAKGNTLLNYCNVTSEQIVFVADKNPVKQNRLLPGVHIPVMDPAEIEKQKPDYILILPWNLKNEIVSQLSFVREWGCKFVVAIPELEVIE